MEFLSFFGAYNLSDPNIRELRPWEFIVDAEARSKVSKLSKEKRRAWTLQKETKWQVYTAARGLALNQRVSKANPCVAIRGFAADYDMVTDLKTAIGYIRQMPAEHQPNFIEITLSGKLRLVWIFSREVLCPSSEFAAEFFRVFAEKLKLATLLPGYDPNSEKPSEMWTNGGEWYDLNPNPMDWSIVSGLAVLAGKKGSLFGRSEVPLEKIAEEIQKRFPGRWIGDFKLDSTGVRFWDEKADCPTGCQVKPDGMLCFTGTVPFMRWGDILGHAWVNEQRILHLGKAGEGLYFDGKFYWETNAARWVPLSREDAKLLLKNRGISDNVPKGATVSDLEQVLRHIQSVNRVEGAAPLINYPPGLTDVEGRRILNICTLRPIQPVKGPTGTPADFPWLWEFLNGLFARPEDNPLPHFLAWLQRAYRSVLHYERLMGQAVFLCGPAHNGKTLVCLRIICPLLGGRIANPYPFFVGDSQFNDDLFESALLAVNDEEAPRNEAARQTFLAKVKAFVVNPVHFYHPKFCARVQVPWNGRLFFTLNDDPASLGLLPEVNANTRDKMMFFASQPYKGQWLTNAETEAIIARELPAFADWLLNWTPPAEVLATNRCGMNSFFDAKILDDSQRQGAAYNLVELLREWVRVSATWDGHSRAEWIGTPTSLFSELVTHDPLESLMREWSVVRLTKALTNLARIEGSGVVGSDGEEREFIIKRTL